jgi:hypothetical protein
MPHDPQTIFLPADPSQGLPARVVPWITVHPYQPPDEASNNPAGPVESDGYPNDWIALQFPPAPGAAQSAPSPQPAFANPTISDRPEHARDPVPSAPNDWFVPAQHGDGYPNDWIGLPATPSTPQLAPSPQPSSPSPAISNRPAPRPDPFTDYWSRIPANHLTQFAWHPPIFPDSLGRYPSAVPAPAPVDMSPLAGTACSEAWRICSRRPLVRLRAACWDPCCNPRRSVSVYRTSACSARSCRASATTRYHFSMVSRNARLRRRHRSARQAPDL